MRFLNSRKMPYKCEQCPYVATTSVRLRGHAKRVHLRKDVECPHCDFRAATEPDVDLHVKKIHLRVKRFKCNECDFGSYHHSFLEQGRDLC